MVKKKKQYPLYFLTHSRTLKALIGKIILMLAIPYAYVFLCGAIFDAWLHMPKMVYFIFFSMLALYAIAVFLIVCAVRNYRRRNRVRHPKTSVKSRTENSEAELISLETEEASEAETQTPQS